MKWFILSFLLVGLSTSPDKPTVLPSGGHYKGYRLALYPDGNTPPKSHSDWGMKYALEVKPRDATGEYSPIGRVIVLSIGMSNTSQEFCTKTGMFEATPWSFMGQAKAHPQVNPSITFVNGAAAGQSAPQWASAGNSNYLRIRQGLERRGLSEKQVQVIWLKVANARPGRPLPHLDADAFILRDTMARIARALRMRYPNLKQVFLSSRTYAGHAAISLSPEPFAYESGLAVKWLIEAQIQQMSGQAATRRMGTLNYAAGVVPWLAWGPYIWDDKSPRSDFEADGTHPSRQGEEKVGKALLEFFLASPHTQPWFKE